MQKKTPIPGPVANLVLLHLSGHSDPTVLETFDVTQVCHECQICSRFHWIWTLILEIAFSAHYISICKLNQISRTSISKVASKCIWWVCHAGFGSSASPSTPQCFYVGENCSAGHEAAVQMAAPHRSTYVQICIRHVFQVDLVWMAHVWLACLNIEWESNTCNGFWVTYNVLWAHSPLHSLNGRQFGLCKETVKQCIPREIHSGCVGIHFTKQFMSS